MRSPTRATGRLPILLGAMALLLAAPVRAQQVATSFEGTAGPRETGRYHRRHRLGWIDDQGEACGALGLSVGAPGSDLQENRVESMDSDRE